MTNQKKAAVKNRIQRKEHRKQRVRAPHKYVRDVFLADRWGVSRMTVWRWSKEGRIPAPKKLGPNSTRWDLLAIEAYEAQQNAGTC